MRLALGLAVTLAVLASLTLRDADARVSYDSPYTKAQTYNAALRLIRVDLGYNVTERDPDAAYILFDYKDAEAGARTTAGSMEIVPRGDTTLVVIQLPRMPRYHEDVLTNRLRRKLEQEYGEPPKRVPSKPNREPDAGPDAPSDAAAE